VTKKIIASQNRNKKLSFVEIEQKNIDKKKTRKKRLKRNVRK